MAKRRKSIPQDKQRLWLAVLREASATVVALQGAKERLDTLIRDAEGAGVAQARIAEAVELSAQRISDIVNGR